MKKRKTPYAIRGKTTSRICKEVEEKGVFDFVGYIGSQGCQPGAYVELRRGEFEATLRREGLPSSDGYNAFDSKTASPYEDKPTRITFLVISKGSRCLGFYEPQECIRHTRHKFEKDAEKDPELKKFLEDILNCFNKL